METLLCKAGPEIEFYPGTRSAESPQLVRRDENTGFGSRQTQQLAGREAQNVPGRARLQPHRPLGQQRPVDQHERALKRKPARCCRPQCAAAGAASDALLVDRSICRNEDDERPPVTVEGFCAPRWPGRCVDARRKLLEPSDCFGLAQERRDPLDRLRPHHPSGMKRASSNSACSCCTSSAGAGVSMESAISAWPPRRVRETVMFAMFTSAAPKSVPTRPITPGTSS